MGLSIKFLRSLYFFDDHNDYYEHACVVYYYYLDSCHGYIYTAFIDNNCKIIEMMIIMSKNDNRDKIIS